MFLAGTWRLASATACQVAAVNTADGTTWTAASLAVPILKVNGLAGPTPSQSSGVAIGQFAAQWTITLFA